LNLAKTIVSHLSSHNPTTFRRICSESISSHNVPRHQALHVT
jgi:hypothetical protein